MSNTQVSTEQPRAARIPAAATVDLKLEVMAIPVSDVDRAKAFYAGLAWTIFKVEPASGSGPPPTGGLSLLFTKPAVMVASVRALNGVRVRTEAFAASEQDANRRRRRPTLF